MKNYYIISYFINDQRTKSLSIDKHPLVEFTNALVNAVRNGGASQAYDLIGIEFQRIIAGLQATKGKCNHRDSSPELF